jgi:hypothetical protein
MRANDAATEWTAVLPNAARSEPRAGGEASAGGRCRLGSIRRTGRSGGRRLVKTSCVPVSGSRVLNTSSSQFLAFRRNRL